MSDSTHALNEPTCLLPLIFSITNPQKPAPIVQGVNVDCVTMSACVETTSTTCLRHSYAHPYPCSLPPINLCLYICSQYQIVIDLKLRLQGGRHWIFHTHLLLLVVCFIECRCSNPAKQTFDPLVYWSLGGIDRIIRPSGLLSPRQ